MSCGCGKKKKIAGLFGRTNRDPVDNNIEYVTDISPADWGPLMWKLLHIMAEHVGKTGNAGLDRDEAIMVEFIIQGLPSVLPCPECQAHAKDYVWANPSKAVKTLIGDALTLWTRNYLFNFHNSVRTQQQKNIVYENASQLIPVYGDMIFQKCDTDQLIEYLSFGVHHATIKADMYKRWMAQMNRLRITAGF